MYNTHEGLFAGKIGRLTYTGMAAIVPSALVYLYPEVIKLPIMKKTFIAFMALSCIALANDESTYVSKDANFTQDSSGKVSLDDITPSFSSGSFAFSFDLDLVLEYTGDSFDFLLGFGDGSQSGELSLSYAPNALTMLYPDLYMMTIGGNVEGGLSMNNMVFFNENSGNLVFQVSDLFGDAPSASLSWCGDDGSGWTRLWSGAITGTMPSTITKSTVTLTSDGGANVPPVEKIEFTAWQGEVTAADIQHPTPAPTVPEPASATLSLLALAGLAARRRR